MSALVSDFVYESDFYSFIEPYSDPGELLLHSTQESNYITFMATRLSAESVSTMNL